MSATDRPKRLTVPQAFALDVLRFNEWARVGGSKVQSWPPLIPMRAARALVDGGYATTDRPLAVGVVLRLVLQ